MATRETRQQRGQRRGQMLMARMLGELRTARVSAAVSLDQLAKELGWSASSVGRVDTRKRMDIGVVELSEVASVLGYEVSVGLHPIGDRYGTRASSHVVAGLMHCCPIGGV